MVWSWMMKRTTHISFAPNKLKMGRVLCSKTERWHHLRCSQIASGVDFCRACCCCCCCCRSSFAMSLNVQVTGSSRRCKWTHGRGRRLLQQQACPPANQSAPFFFPRSSVDPSGIAQSHFFSLLGIGSGIVSATAPPHHSLCISTVPIQVEHHRSDYHTLSLTD